MKVIAASPADRLARRDVGTRVELITPEGVPLDLGIASAGDRAVAFMIDFAIVTGVTFTVALLAAFGTGVALTGGTWVGAFAQLLWFLGWNFYFMFFELRWMGATPGKRLMGLRVIERHGGPLTADAVIVRNLTRDIELFMPLQMLILGEVIWPGAPGWARLAAIAWLLVIALLPLFNKLRLRVGDLAGGTMVVVAPRTVLLPDQSAHAVAASATPGAPPAGRVRYEFTGAALDVYGIYELQVLEDVLRKGEEGTVEGYLAMDAVCEKIQRKIGWDIVASGRVDAHGFLKDFYAALRAHLEHKMLLGERKADKYSAKTKRK
jgi:uncharacterized RDD family membrane protein YckC